ncbi:thiamine pyrophosphate-dependent enzyme [Actinophytocola oryzae]|uniref:Acetolactate synthase-1/2/3 large subunit n=1 Tax=Actinophytocola oryzae TaxID=502181 RepID=A0A4R7V8Y0_9PSEU|nr:thiamine pyrophosphate-dependent enzyme [Actinophytocola oryzae]TDV45370.1 acetolactate synthase-1/2/3 large subunit [Actinophytocola oryzae]
MRLAGHVLVEQLLAYGVDLAFCVPGESYLPVLDGLYAHRDRVRLVTARQETGAAMMAAAYGKLTGRPGICLVTRGPGATNASGGVHVARQDACPMVLLVGQVPTTNRDRVAFQEVDIRAMFAPLAKAVYRVDVANRMPEFVARAMVTAVSGQPGPVVVELPEDVLSTSTTAPVVAPVPAVVPGPAPEDVDAFARTLLAADRPLLVVGGTGWHVDATLAVRRFAEAAGIPLATAVRHQDLVDHRSPAFVGTLGLNTTAGLADAVARADVLAFVGTRPDALTVDDFELLDVPAPTQKLLHVHPDPGVLQQVHRADLAIVAGQARFAAALPVESREPSAWLGELRENYLRGPAPSVATEFMRVLDERVPDPIISTGAGAYTAWPQKHHRFTTFPAHLGTQSGSMGFGLPAAVAAQLVHPERQAIAFAGDGCFLMTGQELATAVRYGLAPLVVVVNNGSYGTIRDHQARRFPGREYGTDLVNPDFAAYAHAFGARGERVRTPDEFADALDRVLGHPAVIEIDLS